MKHTKQYSLRIFHVDVIINLTLTANPCAVSDIQEAGSNRDGSSVRMPRRPPPLPSGQKDDRPPFFLMLVPPELARTLPKEPDQFNHSVLAPYRAS